MMAVHKHVPQLLAALHRTREAMGVEEFALRAGLGTARRLYRWQDALRDDLVYFPNVTFSALGLEHRHLFLDNPRAIWREFPFAIRGEWVVTRPGEQALYLHCLVPRVQGAAFDTLLEDARGKTVTSITSITTEDGWQVLHDAPDEPRWSQSNAQLWDIVERLPLLIPVIFETVEQRHSLPTIWRAVYDRLGKRTWEYLPRFARRLPTNGKSYVKECFTLLNHTGLFRQTVVRYRPHDDLGTPMYLYVAGANLSTIINAFGQATPVIDVHPIGNDAAMLRLVTTHAVAQQVFSSASKLPRITSWHFVDLVRNDQDPVRARFAYEQLFDPATTEWLFPQDALAIFRGAE